MSTEIRVVEDPLAECASLVEAAFRSGGPVVLTGGSTVKAYAAIPADAWSTARVWFSDERCVPTDDERSNYGALVAAVGDPLSAAHVQRIRGEDGAEEAARIYDNELRVVGDVQSFELFVIGLGPDGHICSMFPGQATLDEQVKWVLPVPEAGLEPFVPRVTLTFPAIAAAKHVLVMAAGAGKADALADAFAEDAPATKDVPGSLLSEYAQRITVLTDEQGAARL